MMKNHDIAKLVNDLTAIAKQYGQTEQLRDRISIAVLGLAAEVEQLHKKLADADAVLTLAATKKPDLYVAFSECGQFIRFWTRSKIEMQCQKLAMPDTIHEFYAAPALPAPALHWISADDTKPELSDDVIVTILIDGTDTAAHTVAVHPDDTAVDLFAAAMRAKMAVSRAEGRSGWEDKAICAAADLQQMLCKHLAKGDPVDVGNFCMMLWNRGDRVAAPAGTPFDVSNWIGAKLRLCHQPMSLLGCWVPVEAFLPELSEDVIVTILIDGIETDWKAGYWDGKHWYMLDTEHDEPIQVNAGCNFFVTHWARVVPAEVVA